MVSSAYTYYLANYVGKEISKYDTHKKSELRDVYNRMVKVNKASSLYKINDSDEVKKYAIDLKEMARSITNIASELSENDRFDSGFSKKKAVSSNENIVSAKFVGDELSDETVEELNIKVECLACSQINIGKYLDEKAMGLIKGAYSFDFAIGEYTYEFQFNIKEGETNKDVQEKLARLINRSKVGAKASVDVNQAGRSALVVESDSTGVINPLGTIFRIKSNEIDDDMDVVKYFGLDNISTLPQNARFVVNGLEKTSSANSFTIAKQYMIELKGVSDQEEIVIGLKPDVDSVIDNVNGLIDKYNSMVDLAKERIGTGYESEKLYRDIKGITSYYKNTLDAAGFRVQDDGKISIDEALLVQSANEGNLKDRLDKLGAFKKTLMNKANNISVNPMAYVDKKLISYKNPMRNFNNTYMTSIYSGMMFNGYV